MSLLLSYILCIACIKAMGNHHDITEILLKVALDTINQTNTKCYKLLLITIVHCHSHLTPVKPSFQTLT